MPTETFSFTGDSQLWEVPPLVNEVTVRLWGAGSQGSTGGYAEGTLPVTPGEDLELNVGGQGDQATEPAPNDSGGWNGGGDGAFGDDTSDIYSYGGGGMTDIRRGGTSTSDIVAAAAGGGGEDTAGNTPGDGGGLEGEDGTGDVGGGEGGTQSSGGDYGGSQWAGGDASNQTGDNYAEVGGGGGAGYYGGGAGGGDTGGGSSTQNNSTAGGGGSSYTDDLSDASTSTGGGNGGDGLIEIEYEEIRPRNLEITGTTESTIDLAWDAPATEGDQTVVEYTLYRATDSGADTDDYSELDTVDAGTTTFTDEELPNGERYYYRVTADIEVLT